MELYLQTSSYKLDLTIRNLRLRHPLFRRISINAFNFIIENSFLFKLRPGQGAYKQGLRAMTNIYFILYGKFALIDDNSNNKNSSKILSIGDTIGEEIIFV
jgi:hypothetical protein